MNTFGGLGFFWQNNRRRTLTICEYQAAKEENHSFLFQNSSSPPCEAFMLFLGLCGEVLELLSRGMRENLLMKVQNYLDPLVETMLLFMNFCSQHVFPIPTMFKALIYFSRKEEYVKYFSSVLQCVISWPPTGNQLPSEGLQWVKVPWTISFLLLCNLCSGSQPHSLRWSSTLPVSLQMYSLIDIELNVI